MSKENAIKVLRDALNGNYDNNVPAGPIINYLLTKCEEDEEFAQRVVLENKNVKDCMKYVLQEVKKLLNNRSGWLEDRVVYGLAENYFINDEIVFDDEVAKQKANEKAKDKSKNKVNEKPKVTALDTLKKEKKADKKSDEKQTQSQSNPQMSLFDL